MPRKEWPLRHGRPCVEVVLTLTQGSKPFPRTLLADTGAGSHNCGFELILTDNDCILCGGILLQPVTLCGAYSGTFPSYLLLVQLPALGFAKNLRVVGVPSLSGKFDGLVACPHFMYQAL
jgi:hypothetical protein